MFVANDSTQRTKWGFFCLVFGRDGK